MRLMSHHSDPYQRRFRVAKWSVNITVCEEHKLFRCLPEFDGWTKAKHEAASRNFGAQAQATDRQWRSIVDRSLATYGDGDGVLVSGIYRRHFPVETRDELRKLAYAATEYRDRSRAHWRASGRKLETWRVLVAYASGINA